jgi:hypothetical protein
MGQSTFPRDRRGTGDGHILISGTGRAGTTLLVQYFTALSFDTGFDLDEARTKVDPISHAGLEHQLSRPALPYVSKSPQYANRLGEILDNGELSVRACIVPVRHLEDAAASRRRVSQAAAEAGKDQKQRGGLTFHARRNPSHQEEVLAVSFHRLISDLVRHDVPIHLLDFPRFASDHDHLFAALRPLLEEHGVTEAESRIAHGAVADPTLINRFDPGRPAT